MSVQLICFSKQESGSKLSLCIPSAYHSQWPSHIAFKRLVSQKHPTLYEQAMQLLLTKFYDRNDSACPAHTHFESFSYHGMPNI